MAARGPKQTGAQGRSPRDTCIHGDRLLLYSGALSSVETNLPSPDGLSDVLAAVFDRAPLSVFVRVVGEHVVVDQSILFQGRQLLPREVCGQGKRTVVEPEAWSAPGKPRLTYTAVFGEQLL